MLALLVNEHAQLLLFLMAFSSILPLLVAAALVLRLAAAAPQEHLVTRLPGFHGGASNFPSRHYAGYVTVDEASERSLFYYLVLSERDPAADPVVLWLNGGPGCSSFDGFVYENGPFNFEPGRRSTSTPPGGLPRLRLNPYSWSKVINITIFITEERSRGTCSIDRS